MKSDLEKWRDEKQLTQAQAAELFGVKQPAVAKWEDGRVSWMQVLNVEKVTGIPRWKLRPDIYPEPPPSKRKQGEAAA